jgi:hypothetical protein
MAYTTVPFSRVARNGDVRWDKVYYALFIDSGFVGEEMDGTMLGYNQVLVYFSLVYKGSALAYLSAPDSSYFRDVNAVLGILG